MMIEFQESEGRGTCSWRHARAVEVLAAGRRLRVGKTDQSVAPKLIGLQREPASEVSAGLDDHIRTGRSGEIKSKDSLRPAKRGAKVYSFSLGIE